MIRWARNIAYIGKMKNIQNISTKTSAEETSQNTQSPDLGL
jgi:hypothetical protein